MYSVKCVVYQVKCCGLLSDIKVSPVGVGTVSLALVGNMYDIILNTVLHAGPENLIKLNYYIRRGANENTIEIVGVTSGH